MVKLFTSESGGKSSTMTFRVIVGPSFPIKSSGAV